MFSGLSRAMDCISTSVAEHHLRVGYIAGSIADRLRMDIPWRRDLVVAGLMHDSGALSLKSRIDALQFEADGVEHAEIGYRLLRPLARMERVAKLVRHHHLPYSSMIEGRVDAVCESNILFLADRVDVLLQREAPANGQLPEVVSRLRDTGKQLFVPDFLDAFCSLAEDALFIEGLRDPGSQLKRIACCNDGGDTLDINELVEFSGLFSQIIDFRSRFTATHSSGVAITAVRLADMLEFTQEEQKMMLVAGHLHDLGKLSVPQELLEKVTPLTASEFERIRDHARIGHDILSTIAGLEQVCEWAACHHERIDGKGYPFGLDKSSLSLGSRIVAVADVFTAITEDRPYRSGMDREQAKSVLRTMAREGALDGHVTATLLHHYDAFNDIRSHEQIKSLHRFQAFYSDN